MNINDFPYDGFYILYRDGNEMAVFHAPHELTLEEMMEAMETVKKASEFLVEGVYTREGFDGEWNEAEYCDCPACMVKEVIQGGHDIIECDADYTDM